jgi:sulfite reductase alpha subunit-like flavoprotein
METGVNEAFQDLAAQHGCDWAAQRAQLVAEKRWRVEVY